jgi:hypothetical protein
MSDETKERLLAKLRVADERIAELEVALKKSRAQTQIFANAIADAAIHAGILKPEMKDGLDGMQLLLLLEDITNQRDDAREKAK